MNHMTLRRKTLGIIGATLVGLCVVLYLVARVVLLGSFAQLEERETRQDVERVLSAFADEVSSLDHACKNAATWDNAYAFIENANPDFVKSDIGYGAFSDLAARRLNLLLYVHSSGRIVFGEGFDLESNKETSIPESLRGHLLVDDPLLQHATTESGVSGILLLREGPLLIASRPILTTEGKGPIRGSLIMGRNLSSAEVELLSKKTHLSLAVLPAGDAQLPSDFEAARSSLTAQERLFVRALSGASVAGYSLLRDIYGKPVLILRIDMPREIYRRGRVSELYFVVSLFAVGLVFGLVTLVLLEKVVLSRLTELSADVSRIGKGGLLSARMAVAGNDELSSVGGAINEMLAALQRSHQERLESEERFQIVGRATNDAVWDWNLLTNAVWWNEAVQRIFGYRKPEVGPDAAWRSERIHPEDCERVLSGIRAVIDDGGEKWSDEYRFRCADGSFAYVLDRGYVIRDAQGKPVRMIGAMMDVTNRKRMEQALHESQERFRAFMDHSPAFAFMKDEEGRYVYLNKPLERLLKSEMQGKTAFDWMAGDAAKEYREHDLSVFSTGKPTEFFETIPASDGTLRDLLVLKFPVVDATGRRFLGGVAIDVTERKRAEMELQKAKEAADAANRAKSQFLANMSHEIRTPINGILGMTELALDTDLTPEQQEFLGMVKTSADSLLTILNDILDFSKIEAGKLDLESIEFNLRDSLEPTMKSLALRAHEKGLELNCDVRPEVPEMLVGDPTRLRQVVVNLTGNAIKFTEQGEVAVQVEKEAEEAGSVWLRFIVKDTGIGIAAEKQEAIFDAFTQVDGSTARRYGGSGLGLAISRRLVDMMGGRLWLESVPGQGSAFHFTARFDVGRRSERPVPAQQVNLADVPVLVVDDNSTTRRILEEVLTRWHMKPSLAEDARTGLSRLEHAVDTGRPYPLVLVDAHMPEVDGFTFIEHVRQNPRLARTAFMMLTSGGTRGDAIRCRELGVAGYLTKPVGQAELLNAIRQILGAELHKAEQRSLVTRHSLREQRTGLRRILLAEDNLVNQTLVVRLLEKYGYVVEVAHNGREALDKLKRESFDLVLMDVQMPEMDGFEATAAIRELEKTTGSQIPIIAMTAYAMKGDRERCLAAGMDGYIAKPIRARELFEELENLFLGSP
jgi:two-component system sensor histidine kinase/response regulator